MRSPTDEEEVQARVVAESSEKLTPVWLNRRMHEDSPLVDRTSDLE